jgi:hypothetical protein
MLSPFALPLSASPDSISPDAHGCPGGFTGPVPLVSPQGIPTKN